MPHIASKSEWYTENLGDNKSFKELVLMSISRQKDHWTCCPSKQTSFILPPSTKLWGVCWFHHGCLSVRLSVVCGNSGHVLTITRGGPLLILGSKGQGHIWTSNFWPFPHNNSHFLLAYTDDSSHMYWPWPEKDLYWFWGLKVKGQDHIWTLNFLLFPHDNFISFLHTMMILLHTCIDHDPRRTSIDFGVKKSKVRVIFGLWTFFHFRMKTPFPFGIHTYWPWP